MEPAGYDGEVLLRYLPDTLVRKLPEDFSISGSRSTKNAPR